MADPSASVARLRPQATPDGLIAQASHRLGPYGDVNAQLLNFTKHALAEEGSYFVCTNPTISTTVGFPVAASPSDTAPSFHIANTAPVGGTYIFLDYLRLLPTVAPASGTSARLMVKIDSALRTATAGATITPVNVNVGANTAPQAVVTAATGGAAVTVPAASGSSRIVVNASLRSAIPVVLEEIVIGFGQEITADGAPTTASRAGGAAGPVIIPPQCSAALHLFFPANAVTGLSAEYELAFWQR